MSLFWKEEGEKTSLKDFFTFLIKPEYSSLSGVGSQRIVIVCLKFLALNFICTVFIFSPLILLITETFKIGLNDVELFPEFFTRKENFFFLALLVVYYAFLEEVAFRIFLRYSLETFSAGVAGIVYYIFAFKGFYAYSYLENEIILVMIAVFAGGITWLFLHHHETLQRRIHIFIRKNMRILIWISTIIFGMLHFGYYNTDNILLLLILTPFLQLPRLLLGFLFVFVRMRFGFHWAVVFHTVNNLFIFALQQALTS